jgi:hypothetical protein
MNDSILTSIKSMLGIAEEDTSFDVDIIININSVLMDLNTLGVGPSAGFFIIDKTITWDDFIGGVNIRLDAVKTYIYMKVKMVFDPPSTAAKISAMERQVTEYGWKLTNQSEEVLCE